MQRVQEPAVEGLLHGQPHELLRPHHPLRGGDEVAAGALLAPEEQARREPLGQLAAAVGVWPQVQHLLPELGQRPAVGLLVQALPGGAAVVPLGEPRVEPAPVAHRPGDEHGVRGEVVHLQLERQPRQQGSGVPLREAHPLLRRAVGRVVPRGRDLHRGRPLPLRRDRLEQGLQRGLAVAPEDHPLPGQAPLLVDRADAGAQGEGVGERLAGQHEAGQRALLRLPEHQAGPPEEVGRRLGPLGRSHPCERHLRGLVRGGGLAGVVDLVFVLGLDDELVLPLPEVPEVGRHLVAPGLAVPAAGSVGGPPSPAGGAGAAPGPEPGVGEVVELPLPRGRGHRRPLYPRLASSQLLPLHRDGWLDLVVGQLLHLPVHRPEQVAGVLGVPEPGRCLRAVEGHQLPWELPHLGVQDLGDPHRGVPGEGLCVVFTDGQPPVLCARFLGRRDLFRPRVEDHLARQREHPLQRSKLLLVRPSAARAEPRGCLNRLEDGGEKLPQRHRR